MSEGLASSFSRSQQFQLRKIIGVAPHVAREQRDADYRCVRTYEEIRQNTGASAAARRLRMRDTH